MRFREVKYPVPDYTPSKGHSWDLNQSRVPEPMLYFNYSSMLRLYVPRETGILLTMTFMRFLRKLEEYYRNVTSWVYVMFLILTESILDPNPHISRTEIQTISRMVNLEEGQSKALPSFS